MTHRNAIFLVTALALPLAACGQSDSDSEPAAPSNAEAPPLLPPAADADDAADDGSPDLTPPVLVPEAERGETGARNVLLGFARAIELEEFGQAYAMLGEVDRSTTSEREFAAQFDGFGQITVAVPGGRMEGAAGSLYYEVPTTITGSAGGRLEGTTVLRRVNDVPGASAGQLRWHIERFDVAPA